ncbi:MAG: hypothetical protein WCJ81_05440 [bacterium]
MVCVIYFCGDKVLRVVFIVSTILVLSVVVVTQRKTQKVLSQIGCNTTQALSTTTQMVPMTLSGTIVDQRKPNSYVIQSSYGSVLLFLKQAGGLRVHDHVVAG